MEFDNFKEAGDYLKRYFNLDSYLSYFLDRDKQNKGFVCPVCQNGTGKDGDGIKKNPDNKDLWKCFKCGKSFDVIGLLQEAKGINYPEAVRQIAEWANFDFTIRKQGEPLETQKATVEPKTESVKEADDEAIKAYNKRKIQETQANFTEDSKASEYLKSRGLYFDICKKYGLGYNTKYNSVIIPTSESSFVFRSIDSNAKVQKGNSEGKQSIFNITLLEKMANDTLNQLEDKIFICEGWADCLSLLQSGFQALALNSTQNINILINKIKSFDSNQKEILKADSFLLALDKDNAGNTATNKLIEELKNIGFNKVFDVRNFIITIGKDVNESYIADRETLETKANEIYKSSNTETIIKRLYEDGNSSINSLNDLFKSFEQPRQKAISTGFDSLNKVLYGGFFTGLYILGAVSSLGKTSFALQVASQIAERGQDVLIFSLEMSKRELLAKIISRFTFEINRDSARNTIEILNNFTSKDDEAKAIRQKENRNSAFDRLKEFAHRIYISEGIGDININAIRERIEEHIKITGNTPFVLIDYVQIICPLDFKMTDKQATDRNITELKRISRDFNCVILGISSFNRESYKEEVSLTSFKESGAIEYGSDVLIGIQYKALEREEKYNPKVKENTIETDAQYNKRKQVFYKDLETKRAKGEFIPLQVKILKNRNGRTGKADIYFKPPYNYFTDNIDLTKDDFESPFDI
ncbi:toprim domain-containing protein [bacterium]|nr:toprim domain-containing protein [bacterium]